MKERFSELYDTVKKDRDFSPWSKNNTFKERFEELVNEVQEAREALEKNDLSNLREEIGDILWDTLFLIIIAEEEKLFTGKEVIHEVIEKFKRRKPHIFENKLVDMEEEVRIWKEAKMKEKEAKNG